MKKSVLLSIISLWVSVILSMYSAAPGFAAKPQDEYREIQKRIKEQKKKLDRAKKKESSILTDLDRINRQLTIVESRLRKYKSELKNTEYNIARIESQISENKRTIDKYKDWIKRKIRVMHRHGQAPDMVMLFLSSDDISQLMRSGKALQHVTVYENKVLNILKKNLEELNTRERKLTELRAKLMKQRAQVRAEEAASKAKESAEAIGFKAKEAAEVAREAAAEAVKKAEEALPMKIIQSREFLLIVILVFLGAVFSSVLITVGLTYWMP